EKIVKVTQNPFKAASLIILIGVYFFKNNKLHDALKQFREVNEGFEYSEHCDSSLPAYLYNSSIEAEACCQLSLMDKKQTKELLMQVMERLTIKSDQRRIIDIMIFMMHIEQLNLNEKKKIFSDSYGELISNVFHLATKRGKIEEEGDIGIKLTSVRQFFYTASEIAWHLFRYLMNQLKLEEEESEIILKLNNFIKDCKEIFDALIDLCIKHLESSENIKLMEKPEVTHFEGGTILDILGKAKKGNLADLSEVFILLEQIFLLCHRSLEKYVYTLSAADFSDRLGYFYYSVYCKRQESLIEPKHTLKRAHEYFRYSLDELNSYNKYHSFNTFRVGICKFHLADINYIEGRSGDETRMRASKRYYAETLFAIADDLERTFGSMPLEQDVFYKEANVIPRLTMYGIAQNRYRWMKLFNEKILIKKLDCKGTEGCGDVCRIKIIFDEKSLKEVEAKIEEGYNGEPLNILINSKRLQEYCRGLRKTANNLCGGKIETLRTCISILRYHDDMTDFLDDKKIK
ncbi:MAG: hypothetical protein HQK84_06850, partial [Nitrospinae bacterium]|nr:hypothetical protein [Nitrospinota bacterium]